MTTENKQTQTAKKSEKLENIKQLNLMNQPGGEIVSLLNNIKESRHRLDALLNLQKERDREREKELEAKKNRAKELEEASKPKLEKFPSEKPQNDDAVSPVLYNTQPEKEHAADAKPVPPPTKAHDGTEDLAPVNNAASAPKKPADGFIKKDKPAQEVTRTKQFEVNPTPSYIRGIYTPPPAPERSARPAFARPPQGERRPFTPREGGAPNRFNNSGSPQQGARPPFARPQGGAGTAPRRPGAPLPKAEVVLAQPKDRKSFDSTKKKEFTKAADDKKSMNKRTLIRKGFIQENIDEDRVGYRKLKNRKTGKQGQFVAPKIEKAIITTENLTVKILSEKIGKTAQEIIKQLMLLGIMTTINSVVDFSTMELVANELGVELELKLDKSTETLVEEFHDEVDEDTALIKRPPIITVMGHVDHGKTSLLDAIRKTEVAAIEAGGITQHIGAYSVVHNGEKITFLDTPGHEAFTEMRARGAKVTDIAILVVAADDGIMPQTIEAINHAKAASTPIIVAINKIDKPSANVDKIKQALTEYSLVTEEWGGDTMMVPLSAKTGQGIDKLLEAVLLLSEVNDYKANPDRSAKCSVIEAKLDKSKGPIANIIVQNGTLRVGDIVVSGFTSGKVRAMIDDKGRQIKEAGPSTPVSILGFTDVPNAGDTLFAVEDDKTAKQVVAERTAKYKNEQANKMQKVTLDDMFNKISEEQIKDYNIVLKADVQGSLEALSTSLLKLMNEEAKVNIVHRGVGAINKSDLMLAEVSNAVIIGFNVRPDAETKSLAESQGIDIKLYRVIYEAIEDVERALKGLLAPVFREVITGRAQVRNVFKITGSGIIAGSYVTNGKIYRNSKARLYRDGEVIFTGIIAGLKRFKDDVKDVAEGYECGISLDGFADIKELDEVEAFITEEVKQ